MQRVFGGPMEDVASPQVAAPEDTAVIDRVKHTMRPGEALLQWYARTGLGREQILHMNASEIERFVRMADARNADDPGAQEPRQPKGLGEVTSLPKIPNYAFNTGFSRFGG